MADPSLTPDPTPPAPVGPAPIQVEYRELIHAILWDAIWRGSDPSRLDANTAMWLNAGLKRGIAGLAEKGRLVSPDADTRPDGWAVRVTLKDGTVNIRHGDDPRETRESAEQMADYARRHPVVSAAEVVTRREWVGPWVPVPTGEQAERHVRNALGESGSRTTDDLRKHLGESTASNPPVPTCGPGSCARVCQSCSPDGWTPGPGCAVCWPVPTTKETPDA